MVDSSFSGPPQPNNAGSDRNATSKETCARSERNAESNAYSPANTCSSEARSLQGAFFDTGSSASPYLIDSKLDVGQRSIVISEQAYGMLHHLRRESESDSAVVERCLFGLDAYRILEKALKAQTLRKAYTAARQIRKKGLSDDATTAIIRALFGSQSEKDLQSAFDLLDVDASGYIDKDELWQALPYMSEDVNEEEFEDLYTLVDADNSGLVDFEEFSTLVKGLNSKSQEEGVRNVFSKFQKSTEGGFDAVGDVLGSAASNATSTLSALSTAWSADLPGLSTLEMRKAGVVLSNMKQAGYSDKMAKTICRAIFCEQSEKQLQKAFDFYDSDKNGTLDAVEFREALPLMGESVPEPHIDELFRKFAIDECGQITFENFCQLVKAMNPKTGRSKRDSVTFSVVSDAWGRVQRTWAARTRDLQDDLPAQPNDTQKTKTSARRTDSAPASERQSRKSNGNGSGPKSDFNSRSSGRAIALPPKSQRVAVARQPTLAF